MIEAKDLQERLLFKAQELQKPVLIFTMNGFQMRGVIVGSDRFVIALKDNKGLQMVYKHAISTVVLAVARLFQKIGDDARQWRFEPRQVPRTVNVR